VFVQNAKSHSPSNVPKAAGSRFHIVRRLKNKSPRKVGSEEQTQIATPGRQTKVNGITLSTMQYFIESPCVRQDTQNN
jgi:hypothetical protein